MVILFGLVGSVWQVWLGRFGLVGLVWFGRFGLVGLVWFGRFGPTLCPMMMMMISDDDDDDDKYIMVKCLSVCLSVTKHDHLL